MRKMLREINQNLVFSVVKRLARNVGARRVVQLWLVDLSLDFADVFSRIELHGWTGVLRLHEYRYAVRPIQDVVILKKLSYLALTPKFLRPTNGRSGRGASTFFANPSYLNN